MTNILFVCTTGDRVYVWVRSLGRNWVKEREREKTGIDIKGKKKREGKGRTGKERGGRLRQVCGKEERVTLRSAPCQKERKERRKEGITGRCGGEGKPEK